jgi:hypothetical protein
MTVFEASESARPPGNTSSQTNKITVTAPPPPPPPFCEGFEGGGAAAPATSASSARHVELLSQLEVPGGSGQVVVNGASLAFAGRGRSIASAPGRRGENRVEAQLVQGGGPGQWRFELRGSEAFEPGSLRVVAGEVVLVGSDAIVFRLGGRAGERIVFTFRSTGS